ncbi:MAG: hypothetical protein IPK68_20330 [Bdellovibrionales bacterium]|nr:hypothetical protein [Bdellovibrionales bacterium]
MIVLLFFIFLPLHADETATAIGKNAGNSSAQSPNRSLPKCFDRDADLDKIKNYQKNNSRNEYKYKGYIELFDQSAVDDEELLARLIYTETLAAHCPEQQEEPALRTIAEVILSRIEKRSGDIRKVIFERDQFASSLNIYQESGYKDFLCPKSLSLWQKTKEKLRLLRSGTEKNSLSNTAYNYYLFKHSTRFKPPEWTRTLQAEKKLSNADANSICMAAYSNPQWK